MLERNSVLRSLDLRANNVEADGARAFAAALKWNSSLTDLNLQFNKIGVEV
jgi:hypothetical protein